MSISGVVTLLLSLPLGRLSDRVGAKPLWAVSALLEALLYFAWPMARSMVTFVALLRAGDERPGRERRQHALQRQVTLELGGRQDAVEQADHRVITALSSRE
jgi:MFS family permease